MLREWEQRYPGRTESIFSSLRNVVASHLADPRAADFSAPPDAEQGDPLA